MGLQEKFDSMLSKLDSPRVIELGTKGWGGLPPKHNRERILAANRNAVWFGSDIEKGESVDIVADAHQLSLHVSLGSFDAFVSCFSFEHFRRPWVVAAELAKIVRRGGVGFVATHQSFPLHYYPGDYFRFSAGAIAEIFAEDVGWKVIESGYSCKAAVIPLGNEVVAMGWNFEAEAWLNVAAIVERI